MCCVGVWVCVCTEAFRGRMMEIKNFKTVVGQKFARDEESRSESFRGKYVPASRVFIDQGSPLE
jgi:hypothetical protein